MNRRIFLKTGAAFAVAPYFARPQKKSIRTIAGTGVVGFSPDGTDALQSQMNNPYGLTIGPDGALYFCDRDNHRIRKIDLKTRKITTVAGSGEKAYAGDGGPATAASINWEHELRFDRAGNLFVADTNNCCVRRVDMKTGMISTVAGTGVKGFSGDGGPATKAQFGLVYSMAFDPEGNLVLCDLDNKRLRRVSMKTGIVETLVEGPPLNGPRSLDIDPEGNIYVVLREGNAVFKIDRALKFERVAGTGEKGFTGDGGPATAAKLNGPKGISYSPDGILYIVDTENHVIRKVDIKTNIITTVAGTGAVGNGPDGDPLACKLARPHGVFAHAGKLYVGDSENHRIRVVE